MLEIRDIVSKSRTPQSSTKQPIGPTKKTDKFIKMYTETHNGFQKTRTTRGRKRLGLRLRYKKYHLTDIDYFINELKDG